MKAFVKKNIAPLLLILLILLTYISFIQKRSSTYRIINTKGVSVTRGVGVSTFIGEHHFRLFGYTSPRAIVTLEGLGIFDQTNADGKGYFSIENRFSPLSSREACLTARDQLGRISTPSCLPPFPVNYETNIGPVLLPPTISVDKPQYYAGEEMRISGQAVPNTDVNISIFIDQKISPLRYLSNALNPVKEVYAFTIPELKTNSDSLGNYSIKLPTVRADILSFFSRVEYQLQSSPQSTNIHIKILPLWMRVPNFFVFLWNTLKPHISELILLSQISLLSLYFLRQYLFSFNRK